MNNEIVIQLENQNGVPVVSSRAVAQDFGKRHDHVLRDINNIIESNTTQNWGLLFTETQYKASNGKMNKEYLMTRDGFSLLVMGFTGKEALQWKLKYIEAFNRMEEMIKQQLQPKLDSYMIADPIERAKRWIEEEEVRQQLLLENEQQQLLIEKQQDDIEHQEEVIIGLTQDISIAEKRQRINDIIRYGANGRFADRWNLLYKEFDSKFHISTKRRLDNAKAKGEIPKSMNRMDYICNIMNLTNELFDLATVVFEADYIAMLQDYLEIAKRD